MKTKRQIRNEVAERVKLFRQRLKENGFKRKEVWIKNGNPIERLYSVLEETSEYLDGVNDPILRNSPPVQMLEKIESMLEKAFNDIHDNAYKNAMRYQMEQEEQNEE